MLTHPMPDPIIASLGPIHLRWYGLMYVFAFAQFVLLGRLRMRQPHIAARGWVKEDIDDMLFYGVLGVIIGGRLGEVFFYRPMEFLQNPLEIFMIWHGGMSFHGGFLGVVFAMWLWARRRGRAVGDVYDFIAPLVPLGYAFGRIGNFINAELWGRVADPSLPWAMIWPASGDLLPRHPSPLYQALVDGVLLFVILWLYARRERPRWAVGAMFVLLYGCARFFTEYFRTPDYEVHFAGLTISSGQMLSLPMIAVGALVLWWAYRQAPAARARTA
ncbi:MAG TPA: prolipoprotein diacylglyceryl transferase [Pseudoxanthomonas sp.]